MSGLSDYTNSLLINGLLRATAPAWPAAHYLALFTADPADISQNEATYTGYARQQVTGQWSAPASTPKQTANLTSVSFPANGSAAPVTLTWWGVFDAAAAGNLLISGPITTPRTINPGDSVFVNPGDLVFKPDIV